MNIVCALLLLSGLWFDAGLPTDLVVVDVEVLERRTFPHWGRELPLKAWAYGVGSEKGR